MRIVAVLGVFVPRESYNTKTDPGRVEPAKPTETPVGWCSASDAQVNNLKRDKVNGNLGEYLLGFQAQVFL